MRYIILFVLLSISVIAVDLSDYPDMFIEDGWLNAIIAVGKHAPSSDTIAVTNIALGLQKDCVSTVVECDPICREVHIVNPIPSTVNKFDTEIPDPRATNVISVGSPCVNQVSQELIGEADCTMGVQDDQVYLQLFSDDSTHQMVVFGGNDQDTISASRMLMNYEEYDLFGEEMLIDFNDYCKDSDNGKDYKTPGFVGSETDTWYDHCVDKDSRIIWLAEGEGFDMLNHFVDMVDADRDSCGANIDSTELWMNEGECMEHNGLEACLVSAVEQQRDICKWSLSKKNVHLYLEEYYCENNVVKHETMHCPAGCMFGRCLDAHDFSIKDFPRMFLLDGRFNGVMVSGRMSSSAHSIAMTNIALAIQRAAVTQYRIGDEIGTRYNPLPAEAIKLDNEIANPFGMNVISIGSPCVNMLSAQLLGFPENCSMHVQDGEVFVDLLRHNGYYQLVLFGGDEDLIRLSEKIADSQKFIVKPTKQLNRCVSGRDMLRELSEWKRGYTDTDFVIDRVKTWKSGC